MENDELLSIGKTAQLLGVSIQTLRRWDGKGILKSFRATFNGKRFYKQQDVNIFLNDLPTLGWKWASQTTPSEPMGEFYCRTSDVFAGRSSTLKNNLEKINDPSIDFPLLTATVDEIGENSYAHNLCNWPDISGIFFAYDLNKRVIVLVDRGRGILKTLKTVRPKLQSHKEALEVAFTQVVSGRPGENRGRGLKSVKFNVLKSNVKLTFRTGDAELNLKKGDQKLNITECETFHGCFAVLEY